MSIKGYCGMLHLLNKPFYAFFKGKDYDFKTLEKGEIFLSYADKFNDKFEGLISINEADFKEQFLRYTVGDKIYGELAQVFKWHKTVDIVSEIYLVTNVNGLDIPSNISDELRNFILTFDTEAFNTTVERRLKAYYREINKVRKSFGIKCFTLVPPHTNSIMWCYYGNGYKGFNCCFSLYQIVYDLPSTRCSEYGKYICEHIKPIKYKKSFDPNIQIDCEKLVRIPINKVCTSPYIIKLVEKSLLIKQSQWKHENEIRLLIRDNDEHIDIIEKCKDGFKIKFPYLKTIYICNRKNSFLHMIVKDTKKHNEVQNLAANLGVECISLYPSDNAAIFVEEFHISEHDKTQVSINYTEDDIPF